MSFGYDDSDYDPFNQPLVGPVDDFWMIAAETPSYGSLMRALTETHSISEFSRYHVRRAIAKARLEPQEIVRLEQIAKGKSQRSKLMQTGDSGYDEVIEQLRSKREQ